MSDLKHLNVILPKFLFKEFKFILPSLFFFLFFFVFCFFFVFVFCFCFLFFFFGVGVGCCFILFICFCDNFLCHGSHVYVVFWVIQLYCCMGVRVIMSE